MNNRKCIWGNTKLHVAVRAMSQIKPLPDRKVLCACGRELNLTRAGFSIDAVIPRHNDPRKNADFIF